MGFDFVQQLDTYLSARFTLIVVVTPEEERAILKVKEVCERNSRPCLAWDVADGFSLVAGKVGTVDAVKDPLMALERVEKG